jgi:hypothetical protein
MFRSVFISCLLLVACGSFSRLAGDDKKEASDGKEQLVPVGELVARLVRVEGAQRYLVVQIPQPMFVPSGWGRLQLRVINRDLELYAADNLKVRRLNPPLEFDEKGRVKRYTRKELQDLKGPDPKLLGYEADFDSLKPDQVVRVTLARKKQAGQRPEPKPRGKGKEKGEPDDPPEPEKPQVTMVLILREPAR